MPLFITDKAGNKTVTNWYEVVEVRKYRAQRNVSDTLDYSDYQMVSVVEALVYCGRTKKVWDFTLGEQVEVSIAREERFRWVGCSNLFVWRGADQIDPAIDEVRHPDVVIDYFEYVLALREIAAKQEKLATEQAEKLRSETLEREKNVPVRGKKMVVFKGRKVPVRTTGVVAFVHENGGVLIKPEAVWQDRNAQGVWVNAGNLRAAS